MVVDYDKEIAKMSEAEAKRRLRKLIPLEPHRDTLIELAKMEESKNMVVRHWHKIIIIAGAFGGTFVGLWKFAEVLLKKWVG